MLHYVFTQRAPSLGEPFYLRTLLTHRSNTHLFRPTSFSPLLLSYFNKKFNGFRTFFYAASFLWNYLPDVVRSAYTYMSFRRNLAENLFIQPNLSYLDCLPFQKVTGFECALYSGYPLCIIWLF